MGKCIDLDKRDYYNLEYYSDDDYLTEAPASFMVILLFYVTLKCNGENYLLLEFDNYVNRLGNAYELNRNSIWTAPFITFSVDSKKNWRDRPTRVGKIRKLYKKILNGMKAEVDVLEDQLLYKLGISDGSLRSFGKKPYIEYKRSNLQSGQMKCYYVIEKFVCNLDEISKFRLADPEGLYGHHYLPLTEWWRKSIEREGGIIRFLDKMIPQNIANRINEMDCLANSANSIEAKDLYFSLSGFLFKIDMIGFTDFYNHLLDNAFDLDKGGGAIAHDFISRIARVFEQELQKSKVIQYVIEGDGLTGALPGDLTGENLKKVLGLFQNIQSRLFELTAYSKSKFVGLRCALHFTNEYNYGKIDGLDALRPGFSGESFIVLSRMDQILHGIIRNGGNGSISDAFSSFSGIILGLDKMIYQYMDKDGGYIVLEEEISCRVRGTDISMCCLEKDSGRLEEDL